MQVKLDKDKLVTKIVTKNIYELSFKGFKPKKSKNGDSINLNATLEVVNDPQFSGAVVFAGLNTKIDSWIQDFVHAFGLAINEDGSIPGDFEGDPNDPSTWKYVGPLQGRVLRAEVMPTSFEGRQRNEINRYICAVPQCATKFPDISHSMNMIKQ